jgi:6-phospho-beta-glucosidase
VKIAVIGGAGMRTPLLVDGLTHSDLPIDHIALYDVDQPRLSIIGGVAALVAARSSTLREPQGRPEQGRGATGSGRRVALCDSLADCVAGADFVFTSIRVGGLERRIHDETTAQRHGIVGQETVGPAGFAMAARTIPHMVRYAKEINRLAPSAWIINFTNPVGMVTEAMLTASDRVIGICDTPTELFEEVAHALGLQSERCHFDYFGLNHLGWLREVYSDGEPQLGRLWNDAERLRSVYRVPIFEPSFLRDLKLLPTEYVYYYDQPGRAFENVRSAGQTRGRAIAELTAALFDALREPGADVVAVYKAYLRARSAGYMQIESGCDTPSAPSPPSGLSGYDRIALGVVRAIHLNANAVIPLSVENRGNMADLLDRDVVEVPCVVNANGARPLYVGRVADRVRPLLARVKEYERLAVRAVLAQSPDAAREALASNPLVPDRATADRLAHDLSPLW